MPEAPPWIDFGKLKEAVAELMGKRTAAVTGQPAEATAVAPSPVVEVPVIEPPIETAVAPSPLEPPPVEPSLAPAEFIPSPAAIEAPVAPPPIEVVPPPAVPKPPRPPEEVRAAPEPNELMGEVGTYLAKIVRAKQLAASGALDKATRTEALQAAAKANTMIRRLPSDMLSIILGLEAIVSNNPGFSLADFQKKMVTSARELLKARVVESPIPVAPEGGSNE